MELEPTGQRVNHHAHAVQVYHAAPWPETLKVRVAVDPPIEVSPLQCAVIKEQIPDLPDGEPWKKKLPT